MVRLTWLLGGAALALVGSAGYYLVTVFKIRSDGTGIWHSRLVNRGLLSILLVMSVFGWWTLLDVVSAPVVFDRRGDSVALALVSDAVAHVAAVKTE